MRPKLLLLALLMPAAVLNGCVSEHSLVGKWKGKYHGMPAMIDFKPDHTMKIIAKPPFFAGVDIRITLDGTYKLEEEKLTMMVKNIDTGGIPIPEEGDRAMEMLKRPVIGKATFKGPNEVEIAADNQIQSLKRVVSDADD